MKYLTKELNSFSAQIKFAVENYKTHKIAAESLSNIIVCGMGASGIVGRIVKSYFSDKIDLPIEVINDYNLPRYASANTLVIVCSFSGNTEETVAAYQFAHQKGCKILVITSGGRLKELAEKHEHQLYLVASSNLSRMTLGTPLTYTFLILFELIGQYKDSDFTKIYEYVVNYEDFAAKAQGYLKNFSSALRNKYIVVTDAVYEGVGTRFVQQLQENAKVEAFLVLLPEACHNMVETAGNASNSNYLFINGRNNQRTNLRFAQVKELVSKQRNTNVFEVPLKDSGLSTIFNVMYELDWFSLQLADLLGVESDKTPHVQHIQNFMSNH